MLREPIPVTLAVRTPGLREQLAETLAVDLRYVLAPQDAPAEGSLLIFEPGEDVGADIARLGRAVSRGIIRDAFLVTSSKEPGVLVEAVRAGVREILLLPLRHGEFEEALSRYASGSRPGGRGGLERGAPGGRGRVVAVVGAKHGLGGTTLAVNLASALARRASAALLDLARPNPEAPYFLDIEYAWSWAEAARDLSRCDAPFFQGLLAAHGENLRVLPGPRSLEEQALLTPEAASLLLDLASTETGHVVADLGADLDESALAVLGQADDILLVVGLTLPGLGAARAALAAIRAGAPAVADRVRLVASRFVKGQEVGPNEARELLGLPVAHLVPEDAAPCLASLNRGRPLVESAPSCAAAKAIARLADEIAPMAAKSGQRLELRGLMQRFLGRAAPVPA